LAIAICAALAASVLVATGAMAASTVCPPGEGPGQCSGPEGLAVDRSEGEASSGRLYVADSGNDRVNVFDEDGAFEFSFGEGVLDRPRSVAVDNDPASASYRDVYVADFGNARIVRFEPDGTFLGAIGEGEYEVGSGAVERTEAILIATGPDIDAPIEADSVVYAVDVRRTAGDMLTTRLRRYEADGTPAFEEGELASAPRSGAVGGNLGGLAVDSAGNFYLRNRGVDEFLCIYDPGGDRIPTFQEEGCFPSDEAEGVRAIATDAADRLFTGGLDRDQDNATYRVIAEYNDAGNPLRRFGYGALSGFVDGLALAPGVEGPTYASIGGEVLSIPFPPEGPLAIDPEVDPRSANATVSAEVNPEGEETTYRFEWVATRTCEEDEEEEEDEAACFDQAESTDPQTLPAGTRLDRAEAEIGCEDPVSEAGEPGNSCLEPGTEYSWQVVAVHAGSEAPGEGTVRGEDFEALVSPQLEDAWVTGAGTDAATLHLQANPLAVPGEAWFEYTTEAAYQKDLDEGGDGFAGATRLPEVPLDLGAGAAALTRQATAVALQEGAEYRFRAIATNPLRDPEDPIVGEPGRFGTLAPAEPLPCASEGTRSGLPGARGGPASFLPDCRAYELVSPIDKNGGDVVWRREDGSGNLPITLEKSSTAGSRLTYTALSAFADPKGAPIVSHYIAERVAPDGDGDYGEGEGWQSQSISSPRGRLLTISLVQYETEFEAFSEDLCSGWLRTIADPPLAPGGVEGALNLYRWRADERCGGPAYDPITTIAPPNVPGGGYALELQGTSADGERAIFRGNDTLAGTGAPAQSSECEATPTKCEQRLYSHSAGEGTRYVCVLPGGGPAGSCAAGTSVGGQNVGRNRESSLEDAISADGSRVFWSTPAPGEGEIYMRDSQGTEAAGDDETVAVSAAGEALSGTSQSRWWCAAEGGSAAIYSSGEELYEFHPDSGVTHEVAGEFVGLAGCSSDASVIYLASEEALSGENVQEENSEGEEAAAGEPNLYRYEAASTPGDEGAYEFVGTLAAADIVNVAAQVGPVAARPTSRFARVSPDGGALAFMSAAELTGADTIDAEHGTAAMQAFVHDAGSGQLACASCNPTGARPLGIGVNRGVGPPWAAGKIGHWQNPLYAARALSEDGRRLFFESRDRLVARDVNGRTDVYQWEAPGKGTCTAASPSYSPRNEGCVDLISSGQGTRDVEFRDASPSGDDVFFATAKSLLPQDPGLVDIYDARVGGGLPVPPPPPPPCEGDACAEPAAEPEPPAPASQAYGGPGNLKAPAPSPCAGTARRARALAARAKAARGKARRLARRGNRGAARRAMRGGRRSAGKARRLSGAAKRCRRARAARRAGR
jgi:hypothetical protein